MLLMLNIHSSYNINNNNNHNNNDNNNNDNDDNNIIIKLQSLIPFFNRIYTQ